MFGLYTRPLANWSALVENFETSPREFYELIEAALAKRQIPGASTSRVTYYEAGFLSGQREYLRVARKMLAFDICAAPFGSGFFFSWWMSEVTPSNLPGCLVVLIVFSAIGWLLQIAMRMNEASGHPLSCGQAVLWCAFLTLLALFGIVRGIRGGWLFSEDAILAMPFVGSIYEFLFRPQTFYKADTIAMYNAAVHASVLEVIDDLTRAKGVPRLSEAARKPIFRELARR